MKLNLLLLMLFTALFVGQAMAKKFYRYVDEQGNVHYTDRLPAKQSGKAHSKINEHGIVVEKKKRAKTPEEMAAEEKRRKEEKRLAEEKEIQMRQDKMLIYSYRTTEDIEKSYHNRLSIYETRINLLKKEILGLTNQLKLLKDFAVKRELAGKPVPESNTQKINQYKKRKQQSQKNLMHVEGQRDKLRNQMKQQITRFEQLQAMGMIEKKKPVKPSAGKPATKDANSKPEKPSGG